MLEVGISQQQQNQPSSPPGPEASEQNNGPPQQVGGASVVHNILNHIARVVWHVCIICAFHAERKGRMVQRLVQIKTQRCSEGESRAGKRSSDSKNIDRICSSVYVSLSFQFGDVRYVFFYVFSETTTNC